jgi:hypothetical protein
MFEHFIPVVDVLHLRVDRVFRADFTAETAGDAEAVNDADFYWHRAI